MLSFLVTGLIAAFLGSTLGLGGGFILIPILSWVFKFDFKDAVFFSVAGSFLNSFLSFSRSVEELKEWRQSTLGLIPFTLIGSAVASFGLYHADSVWLQRSFSFLLAIVGFLFLFRTILPLSTPDPKPKPTLESRALAFFSGGLSGLFGIGGGVVYVPYFHLRWKVPFPMATKLSLSLICYASGLSLLFQFHLRKESLVTISPQWLFATLLGIYFGSKLAQKVSLTSPWVYRLFGLTLIALAIIREI